MRLHRFYVLQPLGEEVVIDDVSKINQWLKVFRYKTNDLIILFNGNGFDIHYSIISISTKVCTLIRMKETPSYIPSRKISLCLSLIKKDAFELVVQKATEIGVKTITPVISSRSLDKNLNLKRLNVITIEASEQCGRGDVVNINEPVKLSKAIDSIPTDAVSIFLEKDGVLFQNNTIQSNIKNSSNISIFIGPEGGWTEEEVVSFKEKGYLSVSLGTTTLRAETAAIVASFAALQ